ncbi:hypothetical protein FA15DRAFT_759706 [Coprinopsis marcescibilis]|uniref:Uncharacterized protein n=1 Tax=Coprinopsis marcescibilis TaxID=230819 RepID=A0A5C3KI76_COPMA|nr:hypothetical protein FA15DRAFT_759706 [Coprinopsis marcescibilis]
MQRFTQHYRNAAKIYGSSDFEFDPSAEVPNDPDWECLVDKTLIRKETSTNNRENNWCFCEFRNLPDGEHTVKLNVRSRSRPFWFDKLYYRPSVQVEGQQVLVTRDDTDVSYSDGGSWQPLDNNAYYADSQGDNVTFPFIGSGLVLWSVLPTNFPSRVGKGSYVLDGGEITRFTIPRPRHNETEYNFKLFETPTLPHGPHTITVRYESPQNSGFAPLSIASFLIRNGTNRRAPGLGSSPRPNHWAYQDASQGARNGMEPAAVAGMVLGVVALLLATAGSVYYIHRRRHYKGLVDSGDDGFDENVPRPYHMTRQSYLRTVPEASRGHLVESDKQVKLLAPGAVYGEHRPMSQYSVATSFKASPRPQTVAFPATISGSSTLLPLQDSTSTLQAPPSASSESAPVVYRQRTPIELIVDHRDSGVRLDMIGQLSMVENPPANTPD